MKTKTVRAGSEPSSTANSSCKTADRAMAHVRKAEKSRVHAKQRRTDEAKEISQIAELLPLPSHITKRLDKASILRLAITFLRLKHYVGEDKSMIERLCSDVGESNLMLESLGGFFIVVSVQEEIIYVSENVEKHVGLNQVDMLGKGVCEFVFEKDKPELQKQFADKYQKIDSEGQDTKNSQHTDSETSNLELRRQFFLRMKCSYHKRSALVKLHHVNLSSASTQSDYVLLQWAGYVHYDTDGRMAFLAAVARPLQPTPIMELKMDGNMFISRHSLDLTFMYCDPRLTTMLGYEPEEVPGSSMYKYHHPGDLEMCGNCHMNLMTAGTSISKYYRFLSKSDGWCWLQTRATIVYNTSKDAQYIVCMNYIISEREGRRYLMEYLNEEEDMVQQPVNSNVVSPPTASDNHHSQIVNISPPASHASVSSPLDPNISAPANMVNLSSQSSASVSPPAVPASVSPPAVPASVSPQLYSNNLSQSYVHVSPRVTHADISPPTEYVSPPLYDNRLESASHADGGPPTYSHTSPSAGYVSVSPQSHHSGDYLPSNSGGINPDDGSVPSQTYYANNSSGLMHQHQLLHQQQHQQLPQQLNEQQQHHMLQQQPLHVPHQQQLFQQQQLQQPYHSDHSLNGSPARVPQYPSPPRSFDNELSPSLYMPSQNKLASPDNPDLVDSVWLSAQPIRDSPPFQQQPEAPTLADDMEEISMEHCHRLMDHSSVQAMNAYSDMECTSHNDRSQSGKNWEKLQQVADRHGNHRFEKSLAGRQSGHIGEIFPNGEVFDGYANHSPEMVPGSLEELSNIEDFLRSYPDLSTQSGLMDSGTGSALTSLEPQLGFVSSQPSHRYDAMLESSLPPISWSSNISNNHLLDTAPRPGMESGLPPSMAVFNNSLLHSQQHGNL